MVHLYLFIFFAGIVVGVISGTIGALPWAGRDALLVCAIALPIPVVGMVWAY